jgi:hypothetical protein
MAEFPSNAHSRKPGTRKVLEEAPAESEKTIERVPLSGEVQKRKAPMGKRIRNAFFEGSNESVKDYILLEVLIPYTKDLLAELTIGSVERKIFGDGVSRGRRPGGRHGGHAPSRFDYNGISRGPIQQYRGREEPRQQLSRRARMSHTFEEVEFSSRPDALAILTQMVTILDQYEHVTVADFYSLVGYTPDFTDQNWGWTDLRGTVPRRVRGGGFILDLPPTEPID